MGSHNRYRHHGLLLHAHYRKNTLEKRFFYFLSTWIYTALLIAYICGSGYILYLLLLKELE